MESAKRKAERRNSNLQKEGFSSRDTILKAIAENQPSFIDAPAVPDFSPYFDDDVLKYIDVLTSVGAHVYQERNWNDVITRLREELKEGYRTVSVEKRFSSIAHVIVDFDNPHSFEDVDVCIVSSPLAVAENGAIWLSDKEIPLRVLPFIAQSLFAVIRRCDIVSTMHNAYEKLANQEYDFATFVAGPSKTADIEQSLVLGAHGPKSMVVVIADDACYCHNIIPVY